VVKRYMRETGSPQLGEAMEASERWLTCRISYTEVARAIAIEVGPDNRALERFRYEWPRYDVIDIDQHLVERASDLATLHRLRSLDALHLAAALAVSRADLVKATWDQRLWRAAKAGGLQVLPAEPPG
jgi:hypothetical protein